MTAKQEKLYNRVIDHILEEPRRIRMEGWVFDTTDLPESEVPDCNTVACFAGWAYALRHKLDGPELLAVSTMYIEIEAGEALGLDDPSRLFYPSQWPKKWLSRLDRATPGTTKYAKVVASYAKHFLKQIKTKKAKKE